MQEHLEPDDPAFDDPRMERARRVARSPWWSRMGYGLAVVLAVLAAVTGVFVVGAAILFAWALGSYGSNK